MAGVEIGIDPGSKFTGVAVFTETAGVRTGLYSIEIRHRGGQIRDRLSARASRRRGRRSRNLRYRVPRFLNRTKPKGWLAPSLRHRVDGAMSWTMRISRWLPVTALHVERVAFDTQALQYPEISGVEYQQGTLFGFEVKEYLLTKWGRACAYCGAKDVPLNVDHIRPKARGGSDRVSNLTLACIACNQTKGSTAVEVFLAGRPDALTRVLRFAKASLGDAAVVSTTRRTLWQALVDTGLPVHVATGGRTKWNRSRTRAPKAHSLDALHVGVLEHVVSWPTSTLVATCTGRGRYARTASNKFGFPRARLPRVKQVHGFATGDLVCAVVPTGVKRGTYIGRVVVRARGSFDIRTAAALAQSIPHRYVRLLQRGDGWAYIQQQEGERDMRTPECPDRTGLSPFFNHDPNLCSLEVEQ